MDNVEKDSKPVEQPQAVDWYSFHQGNLQRAGDSNNAPPQPTDSDPYGYHQGPGKGEKPSKDPGNDQNNNADNKKPKHRLTLYEVAENTLKAEGKKGYKQDDIYFRLNDLMVAQGHKKAIIDGRRHINDHMLPRSWNYVDPYKFQEASKPKSEDPKNPEGEPKKPEDPKKPEEPKQDPGKDKAGEPDKPQSPEEKARAEYQKQVEAQIQDKFSLPPIEKGKGYYDAVAKAHPDWKPKQILEEAKRVRHLNNDSVNLKVGERILTISKEERAQMIAKAMQDYDQAQKKSQAG